MTMQGGEYFNEIARHWALLGPPLRPSEPDLAGYMRGVAQVESPRAAILGVTPELFSLPWPNGSDVIAIDHNLQMIEAVWPGPRESAIQGSWLALPLQSRSRSLVLCDGGLSVVGYPSASRALVDEVVRVLEPGGLGLFRLYLPPANAESADDALADLWAAKIPSPNHLKLRLGMAMQASSSEGIELAKIWDALHAAAPDFGDLAARIGWNLDELLAINAYRGSRNRYYFPTLAEVEAIFEEAGFRLEWISTPAYEMGERCPVACFRRA